MELLEEAADEAAVERGGWRSHVFLFKALPLSGGACRDPFRNSEFYRLLRRVLYSTILIERETQTACKILNS